MGASKMKINNLVMALSSMSLMAGTIIAVASGAELWQAMVSGCLFGIWAILLGAE